MPEKRGHSTFSASRSRQPRPLPAGKIEPACPADLDELCRLETACFPPADAFSRQYRYLLACPTAVVRVLRQEGGIVGSYVLLLRRTRRPGGRRGGLFGRLYSMAVSPACRGQGLGRLLMGHLLTLCRRRAVRRLHLEVRADNIPAIALYRTFDFRVEGELPDYYGPGQLGLKLTLDL